MGMSRGAPTENSETSQEIAEEATARKRCEKRFQNRQDKAPRLTVWWLFICLPIWCLNIYAAYHSLEFYVQLRVSSLKARMNTRAANAVVFDREGQEDDTG